MSKVILLGDIAPHGLKQQLKWKINWAFDPQVLNAFHESLDYKVLLTSVPLELNGLNVYIESLKTNILTLKNEPQAGGKLYIFRECLVAAIPSTAPVFSEDYLGAKVYLQNSNNSLGFIRAVESNGAHLVAEVSTLNGDDILFPYIIGDWVISQTMGPNISHHPKLEQVVIRDFQLC